MTDAVLWLKGIGGGWRGRERYWIKWENRHIRKANFPAVGENCTVIFSPSVQLSPMTDWVVGGDKRDDSAKILFQFFLQEVIVSSSGMGSAVHSLMLSIKHFLCRPRRRPPSKVPWRMVLEKAAVAHDMSETCKFPPLDNSRLHKA